MESQRRPSVDNFKIYKFQDYMPTTTIKKQQHIFLYVSNRLLERLQRVACIKVHFKGFQAAGRKDVFKF